MRSRDVDIPSEEQLYRTIEADWVDGNRVLSFAIDGEGTSCARSAYASADEVLKSAKGQRPAENGLAAITPAQLPIDLVGCNGVHYDTIAFDDPLPGNLAHCEIRWRRTADRPSTEHLKKVRGAAKEQLKTAIADQMTILVPPAHLPAPPPSVDSAGVEPRPTNPLPLENVKRGPAE